MAGHLVYLTVQTRGDRTRYSFHCHPLWSGPERPFNGCCKPKPSRRA